MSREARELFVCLEQSWFHVHITHLPSMTAEAVPSFSPFINPSWSWAPIGRWMQPLHDCRQLIPAEHWDIWKQFLSTVGVCFCLSYRLLHNKRSQNFCGLEQQQSIIFQDSVGWLGSAGVGVLCSTWYRQRSHIQLHSTGGLARAGPRRTFIP